VALDALDDRAPAASTWSDRPQGAEDTRFIVRMAASTVIVTATRSSSVTAELARLSTSIDDAGRSALTAIAAGASIIALDAPPRAPSCCHDRSPVAHRRSRAGRIRMHPVGGSRRAMPA
jgi:hypothetical protein